MPMQMKPSQLATFLASMIPARLPVLIVGGPGIAKTSIVEQASKAVKNDLVTSHPAVEDPTNAGGFPWMEKGAKRATFYPFGNTATVLESKHDTVWFLDDLGQAQPAVQTSYMPWLLARRCNEHVLPDHVTIIAATNRRTDRAGVSGILEPVKSRFAAIVELVPDLTDWCAWAITCPDIVPEVIAYLRFSPQSLNRFVASADLVNSPTPRTWHNASKLLQRKLPSAIESAALAGAIGDAEATMFLAFVQMYRQLPNIDAILMDPDRVDIPLNNLSVLYAVVTALTTRATVQNFKRIGRYAERLAEGGRGDLASLLVRDCTRRVPAIQTSPAFVQVMSGEIGQLVGGGVS